MGVKSGRVLRPSGLLLGPGSSVPGALLFARR
jgi:hypothetical protein